MIRIGKSAVGERPVLLGRRWVLGMLGSVVGVPWAFGAEAGRGGLRLLRGLRDAGASGRIGRVRLWGRWILRDEDMELVEALTAGEP